MNHLRRCRLAASLALALALFAAAGCGSTPAADSVPASDTLPAPSETTDAADLIGEPTTVPVDVVAEPVEPDAFERARDLFPSALMSYPPSAVVDISHAAAVLMQECMTEQGYEIPLLGTVTIDAARASWNDSIRPFETPDLARIALEGSGGRSDDLASAQEPTDRLDGATLAVLNAPSGCRERAYQQLGVAERGILSAAEADAIREFEVSRRPLFTSSEEFATESAAWSACMAAAGHGDIALDTEPPASDPSNQFAVDNARCQADSGFQTALIDYHQRLTAEAKERFVDDIDAFDRALEAELTAARDVLTARGIDLTTG